MTDSGAGPSKQTPKKETYTYGKSELDAAAYCEALKSAKAKKNAAWWSSFSVLLLNGVVKLKCRSERAVWSSGGVWCRGVTVRGRGSV